MQTPDPSIVIDGAWPDRRLLWAAAAAATAATLMWFLPSVHRLLFFLLLGLAGFVLIPLLWREGYTWVVLWLAPVAAFDPLPTAGVRAAKYLLIALALAVAISKRRLLPRTKGTWEKSPVYYTLAVFAWLWIRALTGGAPMDGALEALRLSAVLGLAYFWLSEPDRPGGRSRWYAVWMIMGLYQVVVCAVEAAVLGAVRSYGTFPNANAMGTFLIPTIGLAIAVAFQVPAKVPRIASRALLPLLLYALFLTGSRSAWLATAVTLLTVTVAARRWRVLLAATTAVVLAFGYYATNPLFRYWVDTALRLEYGLTHRPLLWEAADRAWSHAPFAGHGLQGAAEEMARGARYPSAVHRGLAAEIVRVGSPHNFYREMLMETGLIGLTLLLLAVASILQVGWRVRLSLDRWRAAYGLAFTGVTAGILVHSYFERSVFLGSMSAAVFYWFLAVQTLRADDPFYAGAGRGQRESG
jgi:O-antigen ligase